MNSSIKIALVGAVAVAAMTACTSAPAPQNNTAPQTSSSTPISETSSPPQVVVTEVVTPTVTNPPQPQAVVNVDNRFGYGELKLGMTLEEARDAGLTNLTWASDGDGTCVADQNIAVSKKYGVVRITLPAEARTSKGIGVGSTFGDVKQAYPGASEYRAGWSTRINDEAGYAFLGNIGSDANKVERIKISSNTGGDCAMYML